MFSKGLLRTFQIAHEFTHLTVLENLMMVPGDQSGEKLVNALFKPKIVNVEEKKIKKKALEVIDFSGVLSLSPESLVYLFFRDAFETLHKVRSSFSVKL